MERSQQTEQILLRFFKSIELRETLFINSHIGFVLGKRDTGKLLMVNDTFLNMTGYSRKELLKMYSEKAQQMDQKIQDMISVYS